MQLKLAQRRVEDVLVIDCNGRIVFGEETALLRDTVKKLLATEKKLVMNFSGTAFMDSGGLGTLVALFASSRSAGASFKMAELSQRVDELFRVTKLLNVFEVYASEQDALTASKEVVA